MMSSDEVVEAKRFSVWPNDAAARQRLQERIQAFHEELLRNPSATLTLERWCALTIPGPRHQVLAERVLTPTTEPTASSRERLAVRPGQALNYRRVRLCYGSLVLSEADNWYVPSRLTDEMNRLLDSSDTAFGRVVKPLNYSRRTLFAEQLWSPLDKKFNPLEPTIVVPDAVLSHHALLLLPDGTPISEVTETYRRDLFCYDGF
jgi:chorismate-pyruvate lyase